MNLQSGPKLLEQKEWLGYTYSNNTLITQEAFSLDQKKKKTVKAALSLINLGSLGESVNTENLTSLNTHGKFKFSDEFLKVHYTSSLSNILCTVHPPLKILSEKSSTNNNCSSSINNQKFSVSTFCPFTQGCSLR